MEENNIVDITKSGLKELKKDLKYDDEINLDVKLTEINDHVERFFDWFLSNEREHNITLDVGGTSITDSVKNIIASGDKAKLAALTNYVVAKSKYEAYVDELKDAEIKEFLKKYTFELNDLRKEISESVKYNRDRNTLLDDMGDWKEKDKNNKEKTSYDMKKDYVDPYKKTWVWYANIGENMNIENIYKDDKLKKVMERVFDDEEEKELRKWTFKVNLQKEDGLAGIIIDIREAMANRDSEDENNTHKKLYDMLIEKNILREDGETTDIEISRKDLKEILDSGLLKYKREWWLDWELNKISKILTRAKRADLDAFAALVQSKSDVFMAVKEWNNALEITWNSKEHPGQVSLINSDNVLNFLCDFNGDGQVATEYKKKDNKEQKNQWDVGTLFGQQVMFTIEQAIKVQNVELGEPKGEQLVINNIVKNMQIADSRNLTETQLDLIKKMQDKTEECTRENLALLVNGNKDEEINAMPEMKIFFLDAIKKINGWSKEVQPDLYDTLIGKEAEDVMSLYETEAKLKAGLDKVLTESNDPDIKLMIREQGLVRVRETIFTKIMTVLDNVEVTTNDGNTSRLRAAGVTKWREIRELKKELLENAIANIITAWIHKGVWWGIILGIGYGRSGESKSKRTKRSRWAGVWLEWNRGPWWAVWLNINLWADVAEQYNYERVINADLSQVKSAKYLGIEAWAVAGIGLKNSNGIEAEAYAGINRQQDPEAWIDQIDKQYRAVSEQIFDITGASTSILFEKTGFRNYIKNHIDKMKTDGTYGKFVTNNEQHLTDDLDFMVRYMERNKFFGAKWILTKFPKANITTSINALLDIIQSGNVEQRRHDVITGLQGHIELTKLSFGVTTNALTISSGKQKPEGTGGASSESWETTWAGTPMTGEGWIENQGNVGDTRLGIFGYYIGARISTWRNMYVPNEAQYLFTQYEMWQGVGAEYINNPTKDLDKYGKYIIALYNDPNNRLSYSVDAWRLILSFDPQWSELTLAKFLNIHATTEAQKWFSLKGNILTIGNVGDMAAYTTTEAKGVRRILCLWSKKLDEATRVTGDLWATTVDAMKPVVTGNKEWPQEKIQTEIISKMKGEGANLETAKKDTTLFFDAEGKLTKPANYTVIFEPKELEWIKVKQGTLLIKKNIDWKTFTVTLDEKNPADELTIIYRDEAEYTEAQEEAKKLPTYREAATVTKVEKLFDFTGEMNTAKTELNRLLLSLEELENNDAVAYAEFLKAASTPGNNWEIDENEITDAIGHLEDLMRKDRSRTDFTVLKWFLDGNNEEVKSYIVDRMKQILAREPSYKLLTIWNILGKHGWWEWVKWPSNMPFHADLKKEMQGLRDDIKKNHGKEPYTTDPIIDPNLIWYTAFYRQLAQKYSITSLGETGYQWEIKTISEANRENAKEWFLNNFRMNTNEVNRFGKSLEAQFLAQWVIVNILKDTHTKTIDIIDHLMKWDEITIDSWEKISIDLDWVFYLLGDCCNESLGMKIKNIKIQKQNPNIVIAWRYSASWVPDKEYKWWVDLYTKSHSITSRVISQEEKISWKHHENKKIKEFWKGSNGSWDTQGWWTPETPPWDPTLDENPF